MNIYQLIEVSSNPKEYDHNYSNYRIYNSSLYLEAECVVDCNLEDAEVSDEQYNALVEKELANILETLKTHGRYPQYGAPKYVAY